MLVVSVSSLPLGVLLWNSPEPTLTVIVKTTLAMGPGGFDFAPISAPLRGPSPSVLGCPEELFHPGDFVPRKAACDVLLTGNAYADAPSLVIGANVRIGAVKKRFYALSGERSCAIPLSLGYLREQPTAGSPEVTVGPLSREHPERERFRGVESVPASELERLTFPARFDYAYYNAAPEDQQIEAITPGMAVMLHGLSPGGAAIHGKLPTKVPRVLFPDERRGRALTELPLVCDTLWFDTDAARCELTFRGALSLGRRAALPSRLVVVLAEAGEALDPGRIEARSAFVPPSVAVEPEDVERAPEPEPEPEIEPEIEEIVADPATEEATADLQELVPDPETADRGTTLLPDYPTPVPPRRTTSIPPRRATTIPPRPPTLPPKPPTLPPPAIPRRNTVIMEAPARAAPDPERTLLHAIPPNRPVTLPFAGGAPRQVLPFDDAPLLRPRTVDVAREAIARDPLPFKPIASDDEEDEEEPRTLRPPAPKGPVATETLVPPAPPAPRFGLPPTTATPTFGLPAATPTFGLPATATPTFGLPPAALPTATPAFGLPPAALPPTAAPTTPLVPPPATPAPAKSMFAVREETVVQTAQTPLPAPAKSMFAVREETVVHTAQTPLPAPAKSMFAVREETVVHTAQAPLPAPAKSMFDVREETVIHSTTGAHRALPFADARGDAPAPRIPASARPAGGGDSTGTLLPSRLVEPDEGRSTPLPFAVPGATGSATPAAGTPPPWAASLAAAAGEARPLETKLIEKIGLLTLEQDAEIRLALWDSEAPLHETLEKHGIDELKWREHRRLCDAALREEADSGGEARALAIHEAMENAKKKRAAAHAPSLDVATYAAVRAVILEASDEPSALASRGIDPVRWAEDHRHYRRRLLKEPGFAEELRKALETAATQTASPEKPSPTTSTGTFARATRPNPPAPFQSKRSAPAAPKVRKIRSRKASGTRSNRHA